MPIGKNWITADEKEKEYSTERLAKIDAHTMITVETRLREQRQEYYQNNKNKILERFKEYKEQK